jgi:lipopolysaccharide/colanic/teichoic acid biosynthesis glycosyltransferase
MIRVITSSHAAASYRRIERAQSRANAVYLASKRIFDVIVACLALVALAPVFLLIALAIYITDPGPIFYAQTRVGRNGREFRFYKFRSMVKNAAALKAKLAEQNEANGPIFKMRNDPRVTRIGRILRRTSLDELPQFVNVLRGDMSLVGPRPHLPEEVKHYTPLQAERLSVEPGLVCLREITGRSELTFERWIETDLEYIANRSFKADLKILGGLVIAVLKGKGAY